MHILWIKCVNSGLSAYFTDKIHLVILTLSSRNVDQKNTRFWVIFLKKLKLKHTY